MRASSGRPDSSTPPTLTVAMVENRIMEMALVGPAARKREDPQSAATITGSMQA